MDGNLTNVKIPENVTYIGDSAFSRCFSLTSIEMSENVTYIGGSAFSGCTNLTNIVFPEKTARVGSYAFGGTPWLEEQIKGKDSLVFGNIIYWL